MPEHAASNGKARWAVLAVLCLAAFTINVATSISYVSLPTLTKELDASSRDLLWIIDGFNLSFAAFVLAAGSLSDRFGRKGALVTGLAVYVVASALCAWSDSAGQLILWRFVAGLSAAIIFPTTLSIISNVYPDRKQRAKAIGLWGAATGMAIALGPIAGGALLDSFWWGSAFVFCAGLGAVTLLLSAWLVPTSRDPETPPLDFGGLVLSTVGLGVLVYTIIEGSERGWSSPETLGGFAVAIIVLAIFALWERRREHPMLDVRLFRNLRFTAASGAVTFAYFALFGFVFLISQYFQFVLGYDVLEAGLRQVPVALSVAAASILGTALAVRFGTKAVVAFGLLIFAAGFVWTSQVDENTGYTVIALQMVMIGSGLGLTSTPATEAIIGVVPANKAGIGSAMNDATRELGGTLGVAVIGSIAVSIYRDRIVEDVPAGPVRDLAQESLGAAAEAASRARDPQLLVQAQDGFLSGLMTGCLVAAGVCLVGAVLALLFLPAHPDRTEDPAPARDDDEARVPATASTADGLEHDDVSRTLVEPPITNATATSGAPDGSSPNGRRDHHPELRGAPETSARDVPDTPAATAAAEEIRRIIATAETSAATIEAEAHRRAQQTTEDAERDAAAIREAAIAEAAVLRDDTHAAMNAAITRLRSIDDAVSDAAPASDPTEPGVEGRALGEHRRDANGPS